MKTLHVFVTQKDLDRGIPGDPMRCAVARALDRTVDAEGLPNTFVTVGRHAVWFSSGGGPSWLGWLPGVAREAITHLDIGGMRIEPFDFHLEVHNPGAVVPDPLGKCPDLRDLLADVEVACKP